MLLDDPLKALDPESLKKIVENLKKLNSTKIITSNSPMVAVHSDRIIILKNGKIMYDGSYDPEKIKSYFPKFEVTELAKEEPVVDDRESLPNQQRSQTIVIEVKNEETFTESGRISLKIAWEYYKGYKHFYGIFLLYAIVAVSYAANVYLKFLKYDLILNIDTRSTMESQKKIIEVFLLENVLYGINNFVDLSINLISNIFAINLHSHMLLRVLHSDTLSFLEVTSSGIILNRFTNDLDAIDRDLGSLTLLVYMPFYSGVSSVYSFFKVVNFWVAIGPFLAFLICMLIGQNLYLKATNNLVRYSNSTKSPLLALSLEISTGLVEIRAIKKEGYFKEKIRHLVDENIKFYPIKFCLKASYMFWGEILNLLFI